MGVEKQYARAGLGGADRGREAGGAGTHDGDVGRGLDRRRRGHGGISRAP
jgi:hypothetical protein